MRAINATALLVGVVVFSIAIGGYQLDDLLIYLPLTVHLRDPSLYPNDQLVAQLESMPYPAYRAFSIAYSPALLIGLFIVSRVLLIGSLWALGRQLLRDSWAIALGVSLLLATPGWFGTLGGTSLLQSEPSQFDLAVPFCLFGLAAVLASRNILAFSLAGIAFNLQPILGAVAMTLIGVELFVRQVLWCRNVPLWHALRAAAVGIVLAIPAVVETLSGLGSRLVAQPPDYAEIVRFSAFYQIFPTTFSQLEYASTAVVGIGYCVGLTRRCTSRGQASLALWLAAIVALCVVGTLFTEIVPVALVFKLMPFRSTLFFKGVGMFVIAGMLWQLARTHRGVRVAVALITALIVVSAILSFRPIHAPGLSAPNDLELAADWALQNTPRDALFATPPDAAVSGFMLFAERSTLGDYKLDTQAVWDPGFAHEAYVRLHALGCSGPWNPWCISNTYATFGEADFTRLRDDFGACYALTRPVRRLNLRVVYENRSFRIYSLCTPP